jgi:hypothetical protein
MKRREEKRREEKRSVVTYESPRVELYEVIVEQGFNASGTSVEQIEGRNSDLEW